MMVNMLKFLLLLILTGHFAYTTHEEVIAQEPILTLLSHSPDLSINDFLNLCRINKFCNTAFDNDAFWNVIHNRIKGHTKHREDLSYKANCRLVTLVLKSNWKGSDMALQRY